MSNLSSDPSALRSAWEVLTLFLIPIGGGIPAGVLLARNRGFNWPVMVGLYLISDVLLALAFEPFMILLRALAVRSPFLTRVREAFRQSTAKTIARLGGRPGPLALVMVSFGIDPMTGRAAALALGHGFITGWLIAIAGDLIYFLILMASTLWLSGILGDGTWAAVIVMGLMFVIPILWRRGRGYFKIRA